MQLECPLRFRSQMSQPLFGMDCCLSGYGGRIRSLSVLPIVIGVTSSNHSGCGGLRRRVTKACPICSSRVAKPAFAVPIGGSPREGFPSQFDLALHVSLPGGDLHTQERSQYCRTEFPICSSRLPSGAFLPSLQVLTTAKG